MPSPGTRDAQIREHRHLVDRVVSSMAHPGLCQDDRWDMEQDGLIGLWQAIEQQDRADTFDGFASCLIRRRIVDGLRQRLGQYYRPELVEFREIHEPTEPDPAFDRVDDRLSASPVQVAFEALPSHERFVLALSVRDTNQREIGDLLGVTRGRVWQIRRDGLNHLRAALAA